VTEGMLWEGRFAQPPHPDMLRLTASVATDIRLLDADLRATRAHARALCKAGLLDEPQRDAIDAACDALRDEGRAGRLHVEHSDEDVHSLVERLLTERLGDVGARIHAGRSRNDLVATDLRLWCRDAAADLVARAVTLASTLARRAEEHVDTVMPGYTHLQRAQPVTLGFHLAAHAFAVARDAGRFTGARDAADCSVLGAGALAGTTLPLEPSVAAEELAFAGLFDNAMDAVADRDFACELLFAAALCGVHLARFAEEVVVWTSAEFGFAALPDEWSTGSSMMPQKRNPDLAELIRARAAGGIADLVGLLGVLKGVPLAYARDLQEDKGYVFGAVDRIAGALEGSAHLIAALSFDVERLERAATESGAWATDVAEALVARGVPFRSAHASVGRLVAALDARGAGLADATSEELRNAHPLLGRNDTIRADARASVAARASHGGTAPTEVARQLERLRALLDRYRADVDSDRTRGGLGRTADQTRGGLGRTADQTRGGLGRTAGETRAGLGRTAGENP
jgi:argininosuccinate lyase